MFLGLHFKELIPEVMGVIYVMLTLTQRQVGSAFQYIVIVIILEAVLSMLKRTGRHRRLKRFCKRMLIPGWGVGGP